LYFLTERIRRYLEKAKVDKRGAVLLGKYASADGHADGRIIRIITHAHSDHLIGLRRSIAELPLIAATPPTMSIVEELGYDIPLNKRLILDYGVKVRIGDETLRLEPAKHIMGAAQVVLEDSEGERIVYTGDFKFPGTPIIEADVLIIEATYGSPRHIRPFKDRIEDIFVELVEKLLKINPVQICGYHGKLQEAMEILSRHGVKCPFIASKKVYNITKACIKHGLNIPQVYSEEDVESFDLLRSSHIYFTRRIKKIRGYSTVILSGWEFKKPVRELGKNTFLVALSDHADFEQLMEYIEYSKPRIVVADAYRNVSSRTLTREIYKRLRIPAIPLPL